MYAIRSLVPLFRVESESAPTPGSSAPLTRLLVDDEAAVEALEITFPSVFDTYQAERVTYLGDAERASSDFLFDRVA
jgi:hypothetical protein